MQFSTIAEDMHASAAVMRDEIEGRKLMDAQDQMQAEREAIERAREINDEENLQEMYAADDACDDSHQYPDDVPADAYSEG